MVSVEMTLYNPSTNVFVDVRYLLEMPKFSEPQKTVLVNTVWILNRTSTQDVIVFSVLVLYLLLTLFILKSVFKDFRSSVRSLCLKYNIILVVFMILGLVTHVLSLYESHNIRSKIIAKRSIIDLNKLVYIKGFMDTFYGMTCFFLIIRTLLLLRFSRMVNIMHNVIYISITQILYFSMYLIVTMVAFSVTGNLLFGANSYEFSSFTNSMITLLGALTRNVDYEKVFIAFPVRAPVFFFFYVGSTYLVLTKVIFAIFLTTVRDLRQGRSIIEDLNFFGFLWDRFTEWLWEEEANSAKNNQLSREQIKRRGQVIESVITKFDEMEAFADSLLRTIESAPLSSPSSMKLQHNSGSQATLSSETQSVTSVFPMAHRNKVMPLSVVAASIQPMKPVEKQPPATQYSKSRKRRLRIFSESDTPVRLNNELVLEDTKSPEGELRGIEHQYDDADTETLQVKTLRTRSPPKLSATPLPPSILPIMNNKAVLPPLRITKENNDKS